MPLNLNTSEICNILPNQTSHPHVSNPILGSDMYITAYILIFLAHSWKNACTSNIGKTVVIHSIPSGRVCPWDSRFHLSSGGSTFHQDSTTLLAVRKYGESLGSLRIRNTMTIPAYSFSILVTIASNMKVNLHRTWILNTRKIWVCPKSSHSKTFTSNPLNPIACLPWGEKAYHAALFLSLVRWVVFLLQRNLWYPKASSHQDSRSSLIICIYHL